jgi:hypothetical protein
VARRGAGPRRIGRGGQIRRAPAVAPPGRRALFIDFAFERGSSCPLPSCFDAFSRSAAPVLALALHSAALLLRFFSRAVASPVPAPAPLLPLLAITQIEGDQALTSPGIGSRRPRSSQAPSSGCLPGRFPDRPGHGRLNSRGQRRRCSTESRRPRAGDVSCAAWAFLSRAGRCFAPQAFPVPPLPASRRQIWPCRRSGVHPSDTSREIAARRRRARAGQPRRDVRRPARDASRYSIVT